MAHPAHDEAEAVMNVLLPLAKEALTRYGAFTPFGAVMRTDGSILPVRAEGGGEQPPQQVIDALVSAFRAGSGQEAYRSTGMALQIRTTVPGTQGQTDAVAVQLEHEDGCAIVVVYPYRRDAEGAVAFQPPFARHL